MWQHLSGVVNRLILSDVLITSNSKTSLPGLYDMTIRERQKGELMILWLVEYLKGAQRSKAGITGLPGIQLTTNEEIKKWWDVLWTTHPRAASDVSFYSFWSSVSQNVRQDFTKFCSVACKISKAGPPLVVCFTEQTQSLPPPIPLDIMLL